MNRDSTTSGSGRPWMW